ncbi:Rid family hydrolase [Nocardia sp. R6R-6]|uniref:Rid family hydrolase n=1 Tax=Nocardia sp. R6R-6 TaxID=3459303 RepID=UPI00403E101D
MTATRLDGVQPETSGRRFAVVPNAPRASGRYAHVLEANGLIFCAGQGSKDPVTNIEAGLELDSAGNVLSYDIYAQARGCFRNLASVLAAVDATLADVVEVNVYLKDMNDFEAMNEVFAETFPGLQPVRTTIGVADLPGRNFIEVRATAVAPSKAEGEGK